MKNFDPSAYSLVVQKARVDDHDFFVGRVLEFPDVEVYEESHSDAFQALTEIIGTLKVAADRNGKQLPAPIVREAEEEEYSGRVTLRLGKTLHRKVTQLAQAEGVSLNMHISSVLAENVGEKAATPSTPLLVNHMYLGQSMFSTGFLGKQPVVLMASGSSGQNFATGR